MRVFYFIILNVYIVPTSLIVCCINAEQSFSIGSANTLKDQNINKTKNQRFQNSKKLGDKSTDKTIVTGQNIANEFYQTPLQLVNTNLRSNTIIDNDNSKTTNIHNVKMINITMDDRPTGVDKNKQQGKQKSVTPVGELSTKHPQPIEKLLMFYLETDHVKKESTLKFCMVVIDTSDFDISIQNTDIQQLDKLPNRNQKGLVTPFVNEVSNKIKYNGHYSIVSLNSNVVLLAYEIVSSIDCNNGIMVIMYSFIYGKTKKLFCSSDSIKPVLLKFNSSSLNGVYVYLAYYKKTQEGLYSLFVSRQTITDRLLKTSDFNIFDADCGGAYRYSGVKSFTRKNVEGGDNDKVVYQGECFALRSYDQSLNKCVENDKKELEYCVESVFDEKTKKTECVLCKENVQLNEHGICDPKTQCMPVFLSGHQKKCKYCDYEGCQVSTNGAAQATKCELIIDRPWKESQYVNDCYQCMDKFALNSDSKQCRSSPIEGCGIMPSKQQFQKNLKKTKGGISNLFCAQCKPDYYQHNQDKNNECKLIKQNQNCLNFEQIDQTQKQVLLGPKTASPKQELKQLDTEVPPILIATSSSVLIGWKRFFINKQNQKTGELIGKVLTDKTENTEESDLDQLIQQIQNMERNNFNGECNDYTKWKKKWNSEVSNGLIKCDNGLSDQISIDNDDNSSYNRSKKNESTNKKESEECQRLNKNLYNGNCYANCPENTRIFDGKCVDDCPENTRIFDGKCVDNCPESNQYIYKNECVANCPEQYKFSFNKQCMESCRENYVYDPADIKSQTIPCMLSKSQCYFYEYLDYDGCKTCDKEGCLECKRGDMANNSKCSKCQTSDVSEFKYQLCKDNCIAQVKGKNLNPVKCIFEDKCSMANCEVCKTNYSCQQCSEGYKLTGVNNLTCEKFNCGIFTFFNKVKNHCDECEDPYCKNCSESGIEGSKVSPVIGNCLSCDGFLAKLTDKGSCELECKSNERRLDNGTCVVCPDNCKLGGCYAITNTILCNDCLDDFVSIAGRCISKKALDCGKKNSDKRFVIGMDKSGVEIHKRCSEMIQFCLECENPYKCDKCVEGTKLADNKDNGNSECVPIYIKLSKFVYGDISTQYMPIVKQKSMLDNSIQNTIITKIFNFFGLKSWKGFTDLEEADLVKKNRIYLELSLKQNSHTNLYYEDNDVDILSDINLTVLENNDGNHFQLTYLTPSQQIKVRVVKWVGDVDSESTKIIKKNENGQVDSDPGGADSVDSNLFRMKVDSYLSHFNQNEYNKLACRDILFCEDFTSAKNDCVLGNVKHYYFGLKNPVYEILYKQLQQINIPNYQQNVDKNLMKITYTKDKDTKQSYNPNKVGIIPLQTSTRQKNQDSFTTATSKLNLVINFVESNCSSDKEIKSLKTNKPSQKTKLDFEINPIDSHYKNIQFITDWIYTDNKDPKKSMIIKNQNIFGEYNSETNQNILHVKDGFILFYNDDKRDQLFHLKNHKIEAVQQSLFNEDIQISFSYTDENGFNTSFICILSAMTIDTLNPKMCLFDDSKNIHFCLDFMSYSQAVGDYISFDLQRFNDFLWINNIVKSVPYSQVLGVLSEPTNGGLKHLVIGTYNGRKMILDYFPLKYSQDLNFKKQKKIIEIDQNRIFRIVGIVCHKSSKAFVYGLKKNSGNTEVYKQVIIEGKVEADYIKTWRPGLQGYGKNLSGDSTKQVIVQETSPFEIPLWNPLILHENFTIAATDQNDYTRKIEYSNLSLCPMSSDGRFMLLITKKTSERKEIIIYFYSLIENMPFLENYPQRLNTSKTSIYGNSDFSSAKKIDYIHSVTTSEYNIIDGSTKKIEKIVNTVNYYVVLWEFESLITSMSDIYLGVVKVPIIVQEESQEAKMCFGPKNLTKQVLLYLEQKVTRNEDIKKPYLRPIGLSNRNFFVVAYWRLLDKDKYALYLKVYDLLFGEEYLSKMNEVVLVCGENSELGCNEIEVVADMSQLTQIVLVNDKSDKDTVVQHYGESDGIGYKSVMFNLCSFQIIPDKIVYLHNDVLEFSGKETDKQFSFVQMNIGGNLQVKNSGNGVLDNKEYLETSTFRRHLNLEIVMDDSGQTLDEVYVNLIDNNNRIVSKFDITSKRKTEVSKTTCSVILFLVFIRIRLKKLGK